MRLAPAPCWPESSAPGLLASAGAPSPQRPRNCWNLDWPLQPRAAAPLGVGAERCGAGGACDAGDRGDTSGACGVAAPAPAGIVWQFEPSATCAGAGAGVHTHAGAGVSGNAKPAADWRRLHIEAGREQGRVLQDLDRSQQERLQLQEEVQRLRQFLQEEVLETEKATSFYCDRIERERREVALLEVELAQAQLQDTAARAAAAVQPALGSSAAVILATFQDMRQREQQALAQVAKLATEVLQACAREAGGDAALEPAGEPTAEAAAVGGRAPGSPSPSQPQAVRRAPDAAVAQSQGREAVASPPRDFAGRPGQDVSPGRKRHSGAPGGKEDLGINKECPPTVCTTTSTRGESRAPCSTLPFLLAFSCLGAPAEDREKWFRGLKRNLEDFGDVEVFCDQAPQEPSPRLAECASENWARHRSFLSGWREGERHRDDIGFRFPSRTHALLLSCNSEAFRMNKEFMNCCFWKS